MKKIKIILTTFGIIFIAILLSIMTLNVYVINITKKEY